MTNVVTFFPDIPLDRLHVGEVTKVIIKMNGQPITGGNVQWAQKTGAELLHCEPLVGSTVPGQVQKFTAIKEGTSDIYCVLNGAFSQPVHVVVAKAVVVPPPSPTDAPAASWGSLHPTQPRKSTTDFYYNTTQTIEDQAAMRFDIFIGGNEARHERMKLKNPKGRFIPYCLQNTCIQPIPGWVYPVTGPRVWSLDAHASLGSGYSDDFHKWCVAHNSSAEEEDAGWLRTPTGARATHSQWDSLRWIPDPRSPIMREYQKDRMKRLAAHAVVDGLFFDEFGTGVLNGFYNEAKLDATAMQALHDAETSLIAEIAAALYPKQIVLNTASYTGAWDIALAKAARGVHAEQLNNPMTMDLWGTAWPFFDKLFTAGVFVNIVPAYSFLGYNNLKDDQATPNYMDTIRGKTLELASAYMVQPDNPALLAIHLENGPWGSGTIGSLPNMVSNYLYVSDADLGKPIETRQKPAGEHYFTRRFEHGMVVFNPVWNRLKQDYSSEAAITIPLRNDRKYAQVRPDGSVGPVVQTVTLRCPEAAIFVAVP